MKEIKNIKVDDNEIFKIKDYKNTEYLDNVKNKINIQLYDYDYDEQLINKKINNRPKTDKLECELMLAYMNKYYNDDDDNIKYYQELKQKIPIFKKDIYDNLTPEDKKLIQLLDRYSMKTINSAIKENINEMKKLQKKLK
jgi:hypothetical protein